MGKLTVTDPSGNRQDYPLTKERITIGRYPDNDICIPDKAVSGTHAVVITTLQDAFLEDLDSTNGTVVNGKPINRHPLSNGDVIKLGHNTLRYEDEQSQGKDDFEKTTLLSPARPLLGKLRVTSGPKAGKELELTKTLTNIGRPGVQVAAISRRTDGYYIVHVVGHEGGQRPIVNGVEIDAHAHKLEHNDSIELAGTLMSFALI